MNAAPAPPHEHWPLASVLVVDDEPGMRNFLEKSLAPRVGHVRAAGSAEDAEALLARHRFDLVVLDISLPGKSGLVLLKELRAQGNACEVVLITAFADLDMAIEALRAGAGDLLLKPFRVTQVLSSIQQGLERARLKRENWVLKRALERRTPPADGLVGSSIVVRGLQAALRRVAAVDSTVLLTGESGTGKELAALALHALSDHAAAPFVPVNCASLSPAVLESELFGEGGAAPRDGLFVYAQGGTLFLDEVESIPLPMQAKLLRVLEERAIERLGGNRRVQVDMRVVAATNVDLGKLVREGRVREDFYYRINVVPIALPPLRERREDISLLVAEFLRSNELAKEKGLNRLTERAINQLMSYDWPGNIRELSNVMERAVLRAKGDTIKEVDVPTTGKSDGRRGAAGHYHLPLREFLKGAERDYLAQLLSQYHGGIARCARHASVDQATLHRKIKAHGLRADEYRHNGRVH